ncbi:MAG: hypothetical protein FWE24_10995 [Defluviitaleaceae bacterium]|nr:hypothetical protein [Defluviitaleaceae bacterium]
MVAINATQVRNEWSAVVDSVIRERPQFIKRTRDYMFLADLGVLENILSVYKFHAEILGEDDGSITITLDEIDLVENGTNEREALLKLAHTILEYAEDYYNDFAFWSRGDRQGHIPYVFKVLILNDPQKIGDLIECRRGEI